MGYFVVQCGCAVQIIWRVRWYHFVSDFLDVGDVGIAGGIFFLIVTYGVHGLDVFGR